MACTETKASSQCGMAEWKDCSASADTGTSFSAKACDVILEHMRRALCAVHTQSQQTTNHAACDDHIRARSTNRTFTHPPIAQKKLRVLQHAAKQAVKPADPLPLRLQPG
jgi:hypothetical protein